MKIKLQMSCDNAAFEDYPRAEAARILRELATDLENDSRQLFTLMDINGNRVGECKVSG